VIVKKFDLKIFNYPDYEKVVSGMSSVCMYVCMYGSSPHCYLNGWTNVIHIQYLEVHPS
jgi:hypothetical protein